LQLAERSKFLTAKAPPEMGAHRLAQTAAIIHALSVIPCRSMQIDFPDTTGKVDGPVLVAIGRLRSKALKKSA